MEYAVAIGFGSFLLASLVVGVRLILLSHRTRQLPELLIGVGVLGIGPLGFGLSMIGALPGRWRRVVLRATFGHRFHIDGHASGLAFEGRFGIDPDHVERVVRFDDEKALDIGRRPV